MMTTLNLSKIKMKKALIFFILLMLTFNGLTQLSLSSTYHQKIIQSYTQNGKTFLDGKRPKIVDYDFLFNYATRLKKEHFLFIGLNFRRIKFEIDNIIDSIEYREVDFTETVVDSGYFLSEMSYRSKSNSLGLSLGYFYRFELMKKQFSDLGFNFNSSFYEKNIDNYYGGDDVFPDLPDNWYGLMTYKYPQNGNIGFRKGFYFASLNLSTFYRHTFQLSDNFSLAARISLGTNLYSDWDQFKKYAWLGVGLEMGFGKVKQIRNQ